MPLAIFFQTMGLNAEEEADSLGLCHKALIVTQQEVLKRPPEPV